VAGLWPIHAAALLGDAKLLRVLMVRGADPDQPLLWMLAGPGIATGFHQKRGKHRDLTIKHSDLTILNMTNYGI